MIPRKTKAYRILMHITSYRQLEEFLDFSMSDIDQRKRPPRRTWEFGFEVETKAVEYRCRDIGRFDGTVRGDSTDGIAGPHHAAPLNAAAGKSNRVAKRPVVTASRGIHTGRAAELREVTDERRIEHSPLRQVFDQGRVGL